MFKDAVSVKHALTRSFRDLHIAVVGDVMLDRHLWGSCERISPEAPVPIVRLASRSSSLGGAANVARNLVALGVNVELLGVVGTDHDLGPRICSTRRGLDHHQPVRRPLERRAVCVEDVAQDFTGQPAGGHVVFLPLARKRLDLVELKLAGRSEREDRAQRAVPRHDGIPRSGDRSPCMRIRGGSPAM